MPPVFERLPTADLLWIDLEYSGLDINSAVVLEVACVLTTPDLCIIGSPFSRVCHPVDLDVSGMSYETQRIHESNGLLEEVARSNLSESAVEEAFLEWLYSLIRPGSSIVHCGYYLQSDREIMQRRMPTILESIGYRQLDIRTLEEAADAWSQTGRYARQKERNHRALNDVLEAIRLANQYRDRLFQSYITAPDN